MSNTTNITPVIEAVITLTAMIISYFIIPFIKAKLSGARWDNLCKWTNAAVKAAEVLFKGRELAEIYL